MPEFAMSSYPGVRGLDRRELRDDLVVALLRDAQRRRQLLPRLEQGRVPLQQRLLEPQDLNGASAS